MKAINNDEQLSPVSKNSGPTSPRGSDAENARDANATVTNILNVDEAWFAYVVAADNTASNFSCSISPPWA